MQLFFFVFIPTFLFLYTALGQSQTSAIGEWQTHYDFNQSIHIEYSHNQIISNAYHGIILYDVLSQKTNNITKKNGLSDSYITSINVLDNVLIIGYESGNVDFFYTQQNIENFRAIFDYQTEPSKKINSIFTNETSLYFATDFGMVEIDRKTHGLKNTYKELGEKGEKIPVLAGTVHSDTLYLITNEGLISASLKDGSNPLDYRVWKRNPAMKKKFHSLTIFDNKIYVAGDTIGVFFYQNGINWKKEPRFPNTIQFLKTTENLLFAGAYNTYYTINKQNELSVNTIQEDTIKDIVEVNRKIFFSSPSNGLTAITENNTNAFVSQRTILPNIWKFHISETGTLFSVNGAYNDDIQPTNTHGKFSIFENGKWTYYDSTLTTLPKNIIQVTENQVTGERWIFSFQKGIYEIKNAQVYPIVIPENIKNPNTHLAITSAIVDSYGNWIISTYENNIYIKRDTKKQWSVLNFLPNDNIHSEKMLLSKNGYIWGINTSRIIAIDIENQRSRTFKNNTHIELPKYGIQDIALDENNTNRYKNKIYIVASQKLLAASDIESVFENTPISFTPASWNNTIEIDQFSTYSIAIDAGNKKWIGTENGVYLIDENNREQFLHFQTTNSPLLSNNVSQIEINNNTGEVFFLCDGRLASYRSDAISPQKILSSVKIFPNPVPPHFEGVVSISNLTESATIKITDNTGRLIYETISIGGNVSWNRKDIQNNTVKPGVYFVFVSSQDESTVLVGKIAVIE
ncbi:MAG: T9SS type A sorting domain-containing protein [Chitinophagaceae bacterium]|nr:T9SS type A sorting domain-containing protein [Chitinophagaceae bacterium]